MAQLFTHQLQPFEENQSPSPVHEISDPFTNLSLARSRSSRASANAPSGSSPINTLHRQLSGDPDAPPPAWKRRSSFTQKPNPAAISTNPEPSTSPTRSARTSPVNEISPRPNLPPPVSRRHPQLQMTTASRSSFPDGMFTHESRNSSRTSLNDPALAPPQPAFLRSKGGSRSNRSSIHSTDTNGMTSEDLWNMDVEPIADLSNPQRSAMERPLDTVRRLSQRSERRPVSISPHVNQIMPVDFMWPTAPPEEEAPIRRAKSKSTTSVPSLAGRQVRLGRKKTGRQTSADPQVMSKVIDGTSPDMPRANSVFITNSAHSSSTDLTKGLPTNRSQPSLGARPPSTFYSRDFLSQLAPREGGYAVAAMLTSPAIPAHTSPGVVSAEEKRRSANLDGHRGSRPPTSRSAGMGRWSLDGGEHYNRPYPSTSSAQTTSSNLSAPPINSPQSSPPADEHGSLAPSLPDGASPPFTSRTDSSDPPALPIPTSAPIVPSPLSRAVTESSPPPPEVLTEPLSPSALPIPPIPADPPRPTLATKQSKKQLAKDAKVAEKAEAAKVLAQRAAKVKEEAARKQAEKDKAKADKEEAKRKDKEEKERKKAEKRTGKAGSGIGEKLKSPSQLKLGLMRRTSEVPAVPKGTPFPAPASAPAPNGLDKRSPSTAEPTGARRNASMPAGSVLSGQADPTARKQKLGLFGTLRKRFSTLDSSSRSTASPARAPISLDQPRTADSGSSVLQTPASTLALTDTTPAETVSDVVVIDHRESPRIGHNLDEGRAPTPPTKPPSVVPFSTPAPAPAPALPIAQADELPPRTTSIHATSPARPITNSTHAAGSSISRSPSRTPQPPSSTDSHSSPPSSSALRARNSIQGPRPMPRSASVTSRTSSSRATVTPVVASVATLDTSSGETMLSQTQSHLTGSSGTYVDNSQLGGGDGEYVGGMEGKGRMGQGQGQAVVPERGDSGDTVRVEYGQQVAAH